MGCSGAVWPQSALKWSLDCPALMARRSHSGSSPLPFHVWPAASRYRGVAGCRPDAQEGPCSMRQPADCSASSVMPCLTIVDFTHRTASARSRSQRPSAAEPSSGTGELLNVRITESGKESLGMAHRWCPGVETLLSALPPRDECRLRSRGLRRVVLAMDVATLVRGRWAVEHFCGRQRPHRSCM